ncbi:MAG: ribosomal protein S18-alanine N-acetyltransferase [Dermatophilaceae bacterium]
MATAGATTHGDAVVLRDMRWTDVVAAAALEGEVFSAEAWSEESWWAELAGRPRRDYVVADCGSGLVGYAGLDQRGEVADVMTLAVASAWRGCGLGRALLGDVLRRARQRGAAAVMLEVRADNVAGLRLYESAGFVVVSVRRGYYQPAHVDALVLRMSLVQKGLGDV